MSTSPKLSIAISPHKGRFAPLVFAGHLVEGVRKIAQLGYDGLELSLCRSTDIDIAQLSALLRDYNLRVSAIGTGRAYLEDGLSFVDPEQSVREKAVGRMKEQIKLASCLGAQVLLGLIRGRLREDASLRKRQRGWARRGIQECASFAADLGVTLALEPINRYETNFINTVAESLAFLKEIDRKGIALLMDTFHMNIEEVSFREAILTAGERISYVHFADSNRWAPGCGHLDFTEVARALSEIGYSGFVSAEILPKPDDASATEMAISYMRRVFN
ncbi:MAG: sugar phosphate isomerase/epimerase [Chloroflexi bacterium]|nr:sugar phosphate isomerase/epimerase [Chloroflexota bacterium]